MNDVTQILSRIESGDPTATEQLLPAVYAELRRLARAHMANERAEHTLQSTALVHEAYLRLVGEADPQWRSRGHFFAAAAEAMRRILIEHARSKNAQKRGGLHRRIELDEGANSIASPGDNLDDLLALDAISQRGPPMNVVTNLPLPPVADSPWREEGRVAWNSPWRGEGISVCRAVFQQLMVAVAFAICGAAFFGLPAQSARADIFQWEYVDPADPSQGKQQSSTLCPGGAGVNAVPGVSLQSRNLTMAYLIGTDLTGANGFLTNLTNADLSRAFVTNARFVGAELTGADFTDADVRGANFQAAFGSTGLTLAQLYSTASYQAHDLTGIKLSRNNLSGANLVGQNLTNAAFDSATLSGADFTVR